MFGLTTVAVFSVLFFSVQSFQFRRSSRVQIKNRLQCQPIESSALPNDKWQGFAGLEAAVLGPLPSFASVDDCVEDVKYIDDYDQKNRNKFYLNVGRALEVLRRELPMVFYISELDFSVFANEITVADSTYNNKMVMRKTIYSVAVKSLRVASSISHVCPSMNVKKIEYLEDSRTIQCLVDVVLPDTVRIDGQVITSPVSIMNFSNTIFF